MFERWFDDFPNIKNIQRIIFQRSNDLFSKVQMRFNFETHFPNAHSNQSIPIQRSQDSIARFLNIPIKYQLFSKDRKIHISRSIQIWIKWKNGWNVEKNLGKIIGEGGGVWDTRRRKFVARQRVQWVSRLAYVISAGNLCGRRRWWPAFNGIRSINTAALYGSGALPRFSPYAPWTVYLATLPSPRNCVFDRSIRPPFLRSFLAL